MKPQIIAGAFGLVRAERIASELAPAIILDLKSQFILRSLMGRVTGIHLTWSLFRIVFLLSSVHRIATSDQFMEQLYGEREDGGSESPDMLCVFIYRLRHRLAPLDLLIKNERKTGWELCDVSSVGATANAAPPILLACL